MNIASEYLPTPEDKESRRKGAKVRGKVRDGTGIACFPSAFGGNEASELLRTSFEVIFSAFVLYCYILLYIEVWLEGMDRR